MITLQGGLEACPHKPIQTAKISRLLSIWIHSSKKIVTNYVDGVQSWSTCANPQAAEEKKLRALCGLCEVTVPVVFTSFHNKVSTDM